MYAHNKITATSNDEDEEIDYILLRIFNGFDIRKIRVSIRVSVSH